MAFRGLNADIAQVPRAAGCKFVFALFSFSLISSAPNHSHVIAIYPRIILDLRYSFYRSSEILAGNYAHIPNHLLSCQGAPEQMKTTLTELKEQHQVQKHHLSKGAQKKFFQNIWNRLHHPPGEAMEAGVEGVGQMAEI